MQNTAAREIEGTTGDRQWGRFAALGKCGRLRQSPPAQSNARETAQRLESQLPAPKKTPSKPKPRRKPYKEPKTNWPLGEAFAYRLQSGQYILLVVCDYFGHYKSGFAPIFGALNWQGKRIPPAERIQQLNLKSRLEKLERGLANCFLDCQ